VLQAIYGFSTTTEELHSVWQALGILLMPAKSQLNLCVKKALNLNNAHKYQMAQFTETLSSTTSEKTI
jgi:hypothetical protein